MEKKPRQNRINKTILAATPKLPNPLVPTKVLNRAAEWVYFGENNLYPQDLNKLVRHSSTLKAVIHSKANHIAGTGYEVLSGNPAPLEAVNGMGYDITELYLRLAIDYEQHGNACLLIQYVAGVPSLFALDWSTVRIDKDRDGVWVSKNWYRYTWLRDPDYKPHFIPFYDSANRQGVKIAGKPGLFAAVHISDYEPGSSCYGHPNYEGALPFAQLEWLIGQYNGGYLSNGMFASGVLNIDGTGLQDDDMRDTLRYIQDELSGSDEGIAGRVLVLEGLGENRVQFTKLSEEYGGSFIELARLCQDQIIAATRWYRSVAGLAAEGTLGNTQQIQNEYTLALLSVKPTREKLRQYVDTVLEDFGRLPEYKLTTATPIQASDQALNGAQVTAMADLVTKLQEGLLQPFQAARIMSRAYNMTLEEALQIVENTPINNG